MILTPGLRVVVSAIALTSLVLLTSKSDAQASSHMSEGSLETIELSAVQTNDALLMLRCMMLGNVRLRLSHGGPDGIPPLTEELEDLAMMLGAFIKAVGLHYEDIAVVRFDGKWRDKTEVPPVAWKRLMELGRFTFDPIYFAFAYESICASGYDPSADTYDVDILKENLAEVRTFLHAKQAKD